MSFRGGFENYEESDYLWGGRATHLCHGLGAPPQTFDATPGAKFGLELRHDPADGPTVDY